MDYLLHIAVLMSIYVILSVSLNLLVGHAGMLSIAHAAFYGLSAYTSALVSNEFGVPFPVAFATAVAVAALASLSVSLPATRMRDDSFVIATFAFQMVAFGILNNWTSLTQGPLGIAGIPRPKLLGWTVNTPAEYALLVGIAACMSIIVALCIERSPFGRVLNAIRQDEVLVRAAGKNPVRFKVAASAVSAALAGAGGVLYAHYVTFIDPCTFTLLESVLVLAMVIIGGAGSVWGAIVGAVVLVTLPEALRFVGLPSAAAANLRQIMYGSLLIAMMIVRPQGLMGRFAFRGVREH